MAMVMKQLFRLVLFFKKLYEKLKIWLMTFFAVVKKS